MSESTQLAPAQLESLDQRSLIELVLLQQQLGTLHEQMIAQQERIAVQQEQIIAQQALIRKLQD